MLGWFQALLPKQGRFFDQFEAHAATLTAGADSLQQLLAGQGDATALIKRIEDIEHQADRITCEVLQDVRRVFVTPFDRSAITDLIGVMDDAIDQMHQTANTAQLYEVTTFQPQMLAMADIIVECAKLTAEAVPLLRHLNRNADRLHALTERIVHLEGKADNVHADGLRSLFQHDAERPIDFVIRREIYGHLERVVDRLEDVANEIAGLVIDHA